MTLKDYINKERLTTEEQKQLIDELHKDPEGFLSDCSFEEVFTTTREVIEKEGLKDGDIAYIIGKKYYDLYNLAIKEEDEYKEDIYDEKKNYWFIKAFELDSTHIDTTGSAWYEDDMFFCPLYDLEEYDYFNSYNYTPLLRKADSECLNSWGCRYVQWGLECKEEYMKKQINIACYLFKLSNSNESKMSLYHIYANGLGVKKDIRKANSFIKGIPTNIPLYAFKSNVTEGIKIRRKPRKKNKVKSFFKKILSLFK